jgi:hypothetical protein
VAGAVKQPFRMRTYGDCDFVTLLVVSVTLDCNGLKVMEREE